MIDIINNERKRYLDFFKFGIEELKNGKNQYATELLIETNSDSLTHPFKLIRLDFIYKDEQNADKITALQLDSTSDFKTIIETINNSTIEIFPFCWDNCRIITNKINSDKLIPWIEKWIDIDDSRYTDFSNSIHNCSMIENIDNMDEIIVDFGTAPIESFNELIDLITFDNTNSTLTD